MASSHQKDYVLCAKTCTTSVPPLYDPAHLNMYCQAFEVCRTRIRLELWTNRARCHVWICLRHFDLAVHCVVYKVALTSFRIFAVCGESSEFRDFEAALEHNWETERGTFHRDAVSNFQWSRAAKKVLEGSRTGTYMHSAHFPRTSPWYSEYCTRTAKKRLRLFTTTVRL